MTRAILLPGLDGSGLLLTDFAQALAPQVQATTITYPADVYLDYDQLASLVLDSLPRDAPFILVAESFSGPIGISVAARQPPGLSGLILSASFARSPRSWLAPLSPLLALPLRLPPAALLMPLMMGRWASTQWSARMQAALDATDPEVLRRRLRDVLQCDVRGNLAGIGCPLHYLQAADDRLVPKASWEVIRDGVRAARCTRMRGPHCLLQAQAQACAATVKHHLPAT